MTFPTQIFFTYGSFNNNGRHYALDTAQNTTNSRFYEWVESNGTLVGGGTYGIEFRKHADGTTHVYANSDNNVSDPYNLGINNANHSASIQITSTNVSNGDYIHGSPNRFRFNITNDMLWPTGPTVTSITVANEIASTRQFTVTHTGTLSASDITYTIDGVDITSLTSPNTPITNLQTTSTGSTFESYTVSKFGTHSINIGEKYLNFLVANSTTNQDIFSSNYNITVNFPALSSGTYTNNLGTLVSDAVVDSVTYGSQRIKIKITKSLILMYVWIYENYNTYQAGIQSFKVLIQQWDYGNLSGNTPEYISNVFYVKPDTLYENTGSPNTLLTFPTGMLVDTYNWNFATDNNVPVSTTTSNGGGKPDRYPLIMTNLFNRNRSLYSIGMTHKDTWDLFL
jgi:hypothetical protein